MKCQLQPESIQQRKTIFYIGLVAFYVEILKKKKKMFFRTLNENAVALILFSTSQSKIKMDANHKTLIAQSEAQNTTEKLNASTQQSTTIKILLFYRKTILKFKIYCKTRKKRLNAFELYRWIKS